MTRVSPSRRAAGPAEPLRALVACVALALTAGCASDPAPGRVLYAWSDDQGHVRYTSWPEQIPESRRDTARSVRRPAAERGYAPWLPPVEAEPFDRTPGALVREEEPPPPATARVHEPQAPQAPQATPDTAARPVAAPPAPEAATDAATPPPAGSAPVASAPPDADGAPDAPDPLDAQIEALEQRVRQDEEALKALISDPEAAEGLRASPALREIAERLPALQAELRDLRAQRAAASGG